MRQIYPLMAPFALALPLLAANTAHANPAGNKLAIPSPPPTPRTASPNPTTTQPTQATTNAVPANPKPAQATANTTPANAKPAPVTTAPLPTAATLKVEMPTPTPTPVNVQQVLYVNPVTGQDTYNGQTPQTAFRTITQALKFAEGGTLIQLAPGRYTAESGEQFPLKLKPGVILRGNEATRGEDVVIEGGGAICQPDFCPSKCHDPRR